MNGTLQTDCLLAVVGLLPREITARQRAAAAQLPDTFSKRARRWWTEERAAYQVISAPALDPLFEKLAVDPTAEEVAAWLQEAGDDVDDTIPTLHFALLAARQYLVNAWPRITLSTFGGLRVMPLSVEDEAEIVSLWAVLNEPTRILDEMDAGSLSPSQAAAFRAIYPALYEHYTAALQEGAAALARKNPDWIPDEAQEVAIAILTGQPSGVATYEATAGEMAPPKPEADLGASDAETQADRSARPVGTAGK